MDEKVKFNPEHYLYDLFDNDEIERLLQYKPPYHQICSQYELQTSGKVSGDAGKNTVEAREDPSVLVHFTNNERKCFDIYQTENISFCCYVLSTSSVTVLNAKQP